MGALERTRQGMSMQMDVWYDVILLEMSEAILGVTELLEDAEATLGPEAMPDEDGHDPSTAGEHGGRTVQGKRWIYRAVD
jgi:hypothetical protein